MYTHRDMYTRTHTRTQIELTPLLHPSLREAGLYLSLVQFDGFPLLWKQRLSSLLRDASGGWALLQKVYPGGAEEDCGGFPRLRFICMMFRLSPAAFRNNANASFEYMCICWCVCEHKGTEVKFFSLTQPHCRALCNSV